LKNLRTKAVPLGACICHTFLDHLFQQQIQRK
jgi:hypothetical protein